MVWKQRPINTHLPVVERWLVDESDGDGVAWGLAGDKISSLIWVSVIIGI